MTPWNGPSVAAGLMTGSLALTAFALMLPELVGVGGTAQAAPSVNAPADPNPVDISPVVRRLIGTPRPSLTTFGPPPDHYAPLAADALTPAYVEPTAPTLIPPPTVVAAQPVPATVGEKARTAVHFGTSVGTHVGTRVATARMPAARRVETAARRAAPLRPETLAIAAPEQPLALSAAQRLLIYRTLAYAAPARAPLLARTDPHADPYVDPYAPPARDVAGESSYPLRSPYPADNSYRREGIYSDGDPFRAFASQGGGSPVENYQASAYQGDDRTFDPYHPGYRQNGIPLVVGARIPPGVWLAAVPASLTARVPAVRSYSYAVIDNQLLLVDPSTGIIAATIAP